MAFFAPQEPTPVSLHIQSLADEELLEFWEEAQVFSKMLETLPIQDTLFIDYEQVILEELQYRFSNKYIPL